jgi:hypothetical protein
VHSWHSQNFAPNRVDTRSLRPWCGIDAWNERHHAALVQMFGARGVDLDGSDADKRGLVMYALIDEANKRGIKARFLAGYGSGEHR